ncbi:MAG: hypothetical protein QMD21_00420 [Candidatus Thermoplasmatota archaeon]|nr:hypothetical protein [Candidatus Thermoplasmatota archaeon]
MELSRNIQKNRILEELLFICIASLITYISLEKIVGKAFEAHGIAVFISFMLLPVIVLRILKKPLELGTVNIGFVLGIALYLILTIWLLCYYPFNREFFNGLKLNSYEFLIWNFFAMLNVAPVDFFTKRIIQKELSASLTPWHGLGAQTIVWTLAHFYELLWLQQLMGSQGALLFIIVSGLATGLVYLKTKNVLGMIVGHWMLNFIISFLVSFNLL